MLYAAEPTPSEPAPPYCLVTYAELYELVGSCIPGGLLHRDSDRWAKLKSRRVAFDGIYREHL